MSSAKSETDAAPADAVPQTLLGRTIQGRYQVESLLGTGGMGSVYRVMHMGIDKRMALKILSQKMMANPSVVARFEREAKAAANFGHPHVAAATDYGRTEDGRYYLVMEYIEGKELRDAIDEVNGPMPPVRAFFIARQIASALSRAHKLGIVHRDLKPENIMLIRHEGHDDFVKVLDFGLALISRHLDSSEGDESDAKTAPKITQVGEIFGTPSYMAPEQTVSAATDTRTDLYALGILMYEMLTGQRPFVGKNQVAIIQQQLVSPPPPMNQRAPTAKVASDMEALVMRLLAKQPAHRFQTPDELISAIDHIGEVHKLAWPGRVSPSKPVVSGVATLVGSPGQLSRKSRRPPLLLILFGAGVFIALLAALLWRFGRDSKGSAPHPEAGVPQSTLSSPGLAPQDAAETNPARRNSTRNRQSR